MPDFKLMLMSDNIYWRSYTLVWYEHLLLSKYQEIFRLANQNKLDVHKERKNIYIYFSLVAIRPSAKQIIFVLNNAYHILRMHFDLPDISVLLSITSLTIP